MSTEYEAFLGIGRRFGSEDEVKKFVVNNALLTEEQLESVLDLDNNVIKLEIVCLDAFSGGDWFIGFKVGGDFPEALIADVADCQSRWEDVFKNIEPRVVHAVKSF